MCCDEEQDHVAEEEQGLPVDGREVDVAGEEKEEDGNKEEDFLGELLPH